MQEVRSTLLSAGRESLLVRSRVTLWPSDALASRNFGAFASRRGARCELRYGAKSVSRLTVALPGGARAVGLRAVVEHRRGRAEEVDYHDVVGFVRGRAEVALTAAWLSRPVERETEQRLLDVLYRRASNARREVE